MRTSGAPQFLARDAGAEEPQTAADTRHSSSDACERDIPVRVDLVDLGSAEGAARVDCADVQGSI